MTISNTFVNGTTPDATLVNENFKDTKWRASKFFGYVGEPVGASDGDLLAHSATTWTKLNGTSTFRTIDAGVNWIAATTDVANMVFGAVSEADRTKSIAFTNGNTNVAISSDSGDTWAQATTDPGAQIFSLSFITATVAVAGTAISPTRGINFSTDGGDTWTECTTGPTATVYAISMFNATTGFAVASGGAIWKTTDGGDNWTDTTHTTTNPFASPNIITNILATSTSTFTEIEINHDIKYYDGSSNASVVFSTGFFSPILGIPMNPIKLTNGNFIWGFFTTVTGHESYLILYKGTTANPTSVEIMDMQGLAHAYNNTNKSTSKIFTTTLSEYDTNKFILNTNEGYMLFDESGAV